MIKKKSLRKRRTEKPYRYPGRRTRGQGVLGWDWGETIGNFRQKKQNEKVDGTKKSEHVLIDQWEPGRRHTPPLTV